MKRCSLPAIRLLLLALALHLAGCAAPRQWTAAELDAIVNAGEVNGRTQLVDFDLLGDVRQQGDRPGQRRFRYVDRPGSHTLGELQVRRTETEEERYQRLLGVFSDAFLRNGCQASAAAIRDPAFESRPAHFKDPMTEAQPRLEDLALARASVNAIIAADMAMASLHRQEAARLWSSAAFQESRRNPNGARVERDRSNHLLYVSAQIERNVRILRHRAKDLDLSLQASRQRLRAQLDADVDAMLQSPLSLRRKGDYLRPFAQASDLAQRFGPCGVPDLQDVRSHVFNRVTTELLFPLRQLFMRSTTAAERVFTGDAELDAAFFGGQDIAPEFQRRAAAEAERRQADARRAEEARWAMHARPVKQNVAPAREDAAEVWNSAEWRRLGPVLQCDLLGAHPDDPEAVAPGVPDERLSPRNVVATCQEALRVAPNVARLLFQLARGHLGLGQPERALEQLVRSAAQGHGASLGYLGDFHLDGVAGVKPDLDMARLMYQQAASFGFAPAEGLLAQFEDVTALAADLDRVAQTAGASSGGKPVTEFANPEVVKHVLAGELDEVPYNEQWVKQYLLEVADTLVQECRSTGPLSSSELSSLRRSAAVRSVDTSAAGGIANLIHGFGQMFGGPAGMAALQRGGSIGDSAAYAAASQARGEAAAAEATKDGITDGFALLSRHRCDSAEVRAFAGHLASYINDVGAPRQSTEELFQACQNRKSTAVRDQANLRFCFCIARKLTVGANMPRGERVLMRRNFMEGAQKIINRNEDHFRECF